MTVGWLDCSAGVSGDMLLGALVDAGAPLEVLQAAVDAVLPGAARLVAEPVRRGGLAALHVRVEVAGAQPRRTWREVRGLLDGADLDGAVRATALRAFGLLAEAEAQVHRVAVEDVHFHEVGAVDAVADVVGAAAGAAALGLQHLTVSTVSVGSGTTSAEHGRLPVPVPAVLALLQGVPVQAGAAAHEATTPTGAALVRALADAFGPLPAMTPARTGVGAGGRDRPELANAVRLVVGEPLGAAPAAVVVEANVDDLDPRVWPHVLERLLAAGAHDAWLTPVLMKKGRPAHVLSVLCPAAALGAVRDVVLTETSTIGLREYGVERTVLDRETWTVEVDGQRVRVKAARRAGEVVNAAPEWDDVVAAAAVLGRPVKQVLRAATAAAHAQALAAARPAVPDPDSASASSRMPSASGR
ncbi:MAG TPA: nickel pincer cofactor biosynthesis protein LarC [Mycobacteriales bacterium]|nr:nickel pincer cofactor biosynthesis protein LarC [Mycobacteriales bacterium]